MTLTTGSLNVLQLYSSGNQTANFLTLMVTGLGVSPAQVGAAAAADPGGKIQIVAGQFGGVASSAIQAQVEAVASRSSQRHPGQLDGRRKQVTTATFPGSRTGPVVAYITGDTLYLVQSSDPALTEDAVKQLP